MILEAGKTLETSNELPKILGLTADSRAVRKGYLFAAIPGGKFDGRMFIHDAILNGAKAVLAPKGTPQPDDFPKDGSVAWITDANPRKLFARMASEFYGAQPERIVAVTGTNGKTSTAIFTHQIWNALGYRSASIGTLGIRSTLRNTEASMTTPDPVTLYAELADLAAAGISHLVMEASSHGLEQHRLDGVRLSAAAFTNLTRDHLDYHPSMEDYLHSKSRLFQDVLPEGGAAVLNADVVEYDALYRICSERKQSVIRYGRNPGSLTLHETHPELDGQTIRFTAFGKPYKTLFPLIGDFQVMNMLCAFGLVVGALETSGSAPDPDKIDQIVSFVQNLHGAPGRLEKVPGSPEGTAVYIDYAHTPDALDNILRAVRPHARSRLMCVFGCGGNRDKGKRPLMGRIAARLADHVIVTDDNPRFEDPATIRRQILNTATGATEIADRREAIRHGVSSLKDGDILVIAGKGHEKGQIFHDTVQPFDDREEARLAIEEIWNR